ncbi:MAG: hypothetical protein KME46_08400 [Brasilonema angustatum HA4187-MV1]|jgi:hypothetical protein|nr:hypothetical protein [Brasilonema angustatum HA4187-MV1]
MTLTGKTSGLAARSASRSLRLAPLTWGASTEARSVALCAIGGFPDRGIWRWKPRHMLQVGRAYPFAVARLGEPLLQEGFPTEAYGVRAGSLRTT